MPRVIFVPSSVTLPSPHQSSQVSRTVRVPIMASQQLAQIDGAPLWADMPVMQPAFVVHNPMEHVVSWHLPFHARHRKVETAILSTDELSTKLWDTSPIERWVENEASGDVLVQHLIDIKDGVWKFVFTGADNDRGRFAEWFSAQKKKHAIDIECIDPNQRMELQQWMSDAFRGDDFYTFFGHAKSGVAFLRNEADIVLLKLRWADLLVNCEVRDDS